MWENLAFPLFFPSPPFTVQSAMSAVVTVSHDTPRLGFLGFHVYTVRPHVSVERADRGLDLFSECTAVCKQHTWAALHTYFHTCYYKPICHGSSVLWVACVCCHYINEVIASWWVCAYVVLSSKRDAIDILRSLQEDFRFKCALKTTK